MNEQQLISCKKILESVLRRPVSRLFWDASGELTNKNIEQPISLSYINDRLGKGLYPSTSAFVKDMRMVFLNGDSYDNRNSIRPAAISLLMEDFEKALAIYSPSSSSALNTKLKITLNDIQEITDSAKSSENIEKNSTILEDQKPGCNFIANSSEIPPEKITCEDLKNEVNLLKTSKLLLKVIQFIYNLQPEAIALSSGVSILFSLLKPENIQKIHIFVIGLLHDSATGKIDGLEPSFLDERETSVGQQISYTKNLDQERRYKEKTKKKKSLPK